MRVRASGQWIVDASVALKWHLRDEEYVRQADALFNTFTNGEAQLFAPSFIRYEVANAFLVASRRGRISLEDAREHLRDFLALPIYQAEDSNNLVSSAMELASILNISVYDAIYVELARQISSGFVTADKNLYDRVQETSSETVWIENLQV